MASSTEIWHTQESLSHLVNIDSLLTKLKREPAPTGQPTAPSEPKRDSVASLSVERGILNLKWPNELLSESLKTKLVEPAPTAQPAYQAPEHRSLLDLTPKPSLRFEDKLNEILALLVKDVLATRDRLLTLNPGRRKMVEHRLEFVARKIARARGERHNRPLSLPEILKESYRDSSSQTKLGNLAWKTFVSEVAIYHMLELFFLKALDVHGWRQFEVSDLGRMNFAANTFLSQKASGFAHDKHCWNFVRSNLYSWYAPTNTTLEAMQKLLGELAQTSADFTWTDRDLIQWITDLPAELRLNYFEFHGENQTAELMLDIVEKQLAFPLTATFQGRPACKKFFIPALESGAFALSILDRLLTQVRPTDEAAQLHRALWASESESFEVFWTEVLALLKVLRTTPSRNDWSFTDFQVNPMTMHRVPQAMHVVHMLGLELHNMDQLPLNGADVSKLQQGSAAQIQQLETFDGAFVTDHPDRVKSAKWLKAISEKIPYWRTLVGNSSNLNWGELHLFLAVSKLREDGYCVYLSHRTLPEGGDGDKFRKALLGLAQLEYFVELHDEARLPYRYLYLFKRVTNKVERDRHRPRFGHLREPGKGRGNYIDLSLLEEANSSQGEIAERGWDHLFVRGAAPLIRHLNHKFPKLFQLATVQSFLGQPGSMPGASQDLFSGMQTKALEICIERSDDKPLAVKFVPASQTANPTGSEKLYVFPHNPVDLPWLQSLLNSSATQFWIRHQILASSKQPRFHDLRSCPIVDLSHAPTEAVHDSLGWLGETKPDGLKLREWSSAKDSPLTDRYAKYVAVSKYYSSLEKVVARYRPLFTSSTFEEMRPEAVNHFYPVSLLCHVSQSPDIRIQYGDRTRSNLLPENWSIGETHSVIQQISGRPTCYTVIHTRQGPTIQILVPAPIRAFLNSQLQALRDHTWSEALSMLRIPRDIPLFAAQTNEITRVVCETAKDMAIYQQVLEEMSLDLFEVSSELRQYLPH